MMEDERQELIGGESRFLELGALYGYGSGITVLALAWARCKHMSKRSMGAWLISFGKRLMEEGEDP